MGGISVEDRVFRLGGRAVFECRLSTNRHAVMALSEYLGLLREGPLRPAETVVIRALFREAARRPMICERNLRKGVLRRILP